MTTVSSSTRPRSSIGACALTAHRKNVPDHSRDHSPITKLMYGMEREIVPSDTSESPPPAPNKGGSNSESENPVIESPKPKAHAPRTNQDWWPNQVDVSKLHPHSPYSNPLGDDFDYAKEFAKLDPE